MLLQERLIRLTERDDREIERRQQEKAEEARLSIEGGEQRRGKAEYRADAEPGHDIEPIKTHDLLGARVLLRDDSLRQPGIGKQIGEAEDEIDDRVKPEIEGRESMSRRERHEKSRDEIGRGGARRP